MNYLTNYYKNLSEELSNKVKLLENYLYEMNTEIASAEQKVQVEPKTNIEPTIVKSTTTVTNKNPSEKDIDSQEFRRGAPPHPGKEPERRDGETEEEFQERLRLYRLQHYRWERWLDVRNDNVYNIPGGQYRDIRVYPNPPKMPYRRVDNGDGGYSYEALPPFRVGDTYITENGDVWVVGEDGNWQEWKPSRYG